jgi:hypothetical protein
VALVADRRDALPAVNGNPTTLDDIEALHRLCARDLTIRQMARIMRRDAKWVARYRPRDPLASLPGRDPAYIPADRAGPYKSRWWDRWNALCGTTLTRADADTMVPQ